MVFTPRTVCTSLKYTMFDFLHVLLNRQAFIDVFLVSEQIMNYRHPCTAKLGLPPLTRVLALGAIKVGTREIPIFCEQTEAQRGEVFAQVSG